MIHIILHKIDLLKCAPILAFQYNRIVSIFDQIISSVISKCVFVIH